MSHHFLNIWVRIVSIRFGYCLAHLLAALLSSCVGLSSGRLFGLALAHRALHLAVSRAYVLEVVRISAGLGLAHYVLEVVRSSAVVLYITFGASIPLMRGGFMA